MIKVFMNKSELTSADDYMFDMLFESSTLDNARAFVVAGSFDELYNFSTIVDDIVIRYNSKEFTRQDCPFWYGIVCYN